MMFRARSLGLLTLALISEVSLSSEGASREIELRIAVDKDQYFSGETIIVESEIKNVSEGPRVVIEPFAISFVITYHLERIEEGVRTQIEPKVSGSGPPLWSARAVTLGSRASTRSSCDLTRQYGGLALEPGTYALRAVYHKGVYGTSEYRNDVVGSNELAFVVRSLSGEDRKAWGILVGGANGPDPNTRIAQLRQFLDSYLDIVFRTRALDELLRREYQRGNWKGVIAVCEELRSGRMSTEKRNLVLFEEGLAWHRAGDTDMAAKRLEKCSLVEAERFLAQLRQGERGE